MKSICRALVTWCDKTMISAGISFSCQLSICYGFIIYLDKISVLWFRQIVGEVGILGRFLSCCCGCSGGSGGSGSSRCCCFRCIIILLSTSYSQMQGTYITWKFKNRYARVEWTRLLQLFNAFLFRSKAVTNRIFFLSKIPVFLFRHILNCHLLYVPWSIARNDSTRIFSFRDLI